MIIHKGYGDLKLINPVVTTGIFDGVHRGHRVLLDTLVSKSEKLLGESVVVTFSPHPRLVLDKNPGELSFLTSPDEKKDLLEASGVDHLIIIEFTREFSAITACDFVKEVLVEKIGTRHLVIGYDHHFGRGGKGDFNTIEECAGIYGLDVERVKGFYDDRGPVSSSSIRNALVTGNLEEANNRLGYFFALSGSVVKGRQIGRTIGFPTANIEPEYDHKLIPCKGVYAVEVVISGEKYAGMLSIGSNPTVNNDPMKRYIEVNILDFDNDIYGERITLVFRKRIRDELKFENASQLAEQIKIDREHVLRFFS
jgi:riboflavin kinase / FMN adenylyltransferase